MKTKTIEYYQITEHPQPEKVYNWVRENWHNLGDYAVNDAVKSIKALADHINGTYDYSISIVPDRGEYITIKPPYEMEGLKGVALYSKWNIDKDFLSGNCPLTGVVYDENLLDAFRTKNHNLTFNKILDNAGKKLLKAIHLEGEYIYSDEGIRDLCEANEYYFNLEGEAE